jgi:hypothetical protein
MKEGEEANRCVQIPADAYGQNLELAVRSVRSCTMQSRFVGDPPRPRYTSGAAGFRPIALTLRISLIWLLNALPPAEAHRSARRTQAGANHVVLADNRDMRQRRVVHALLTARR